LDLYAKKFFGWIVALFLALGAFFQASGVSQLVGASLLESEDSSDVKLPAANVAIAPPRVHSSAEPILHRNPFDSTTGPLDQKPVELLEPPKPVLDLSNPLAAPACDGIEVLIVTESADPTWSLTALKGSGETVPSMKRVGDKVGDREVAFIGYNSAAQSPSVWLATESSLCQVLLFNPPAGAATAAAAPLVPPPPAEVPVPKESPAPGPARGAVPPEIASKIQKTSDTEFAIDRATVDEILGDTTTLMRQTRIVPETKGGETVGLRLFGIRSDTLLGMLGLKNGDRLEEINGFKMGSPEQALQAYAGVRAANNLTVKINRGGKPMTLDYQFK
jgi:general secretion pathway protein C